MRTAKPNQNSRSQGEMLVLAKAKRFGKSGVGCPPLCNSGAVLIGFYFRILGSVQE